MDIKVGEYVRLSRNQGINKIIEIEEDGCFVLDDIIADKWGDEADRIYPQDIEEEILKHSKNIIDLIEVGDYVNGRLVLQVDYKNKNVCLLISFTDTQANTNICWYGNEDIKSVVTKEQFDREKYVVGG